MNPITMKLVVDDLILQALREDITFEDVSTASVCPTARPATVELIAKADGIIAGLDVFARTFELLDSQSSVLFDVADGDEVHAGDHVGQVRGDARVLLSGERVALNYLQRMSGIATMTAAFVDAVNAIYGDDYDGPVTRPRRYERTRIVDTRKTTPGLRPFEKYAVVCGGGPNHRYGLSDAVMMKDNHLAALAARGIDLAGAIRHVREQVGHTTHIEVEVDRLDQIPAVLAGGADTIMLDNFSLDDTRRGVDIINGKAIVEASGNMSMERVPAVAATGVDVISVGALTHSVRSIDLGLDWN